MANASQQALLMRMREVVTTHANHPAVREHQESFNYSRFAALISNAYRALADTGLQGGAPVGVLIDRSAIAYAAMWAAIGHGSPYVPLNTSYPVSRLRDICAQANIAAVMCDDSTHELASNLGIDPAKRITLTIDRRGDEAQAAEVPWWEARPGGDIAYVLFTSGSTGKPKGVPISYDNLLAFVDNMDAAIGYQQKDVCSQVCELSFDFSVHEIYLALLNGCTLCPARRIDLFNPANYIASREITVWISVPSLARVMLNNAIAIGDSLQKVRLSIFNGEPLTASLAAAWQAAAPHAEVWNSYGPTECTVAVTTQRWTGNTDDVENDVVAVGKPLSNVRTALLRGTDIVPTATAQENSTGELLLDGPQRFSGYTDPALATPFITSDDGATYYRTGDRVRWRNGKLYHLGRLDHQVKIGGHRIELLEIEHRLRHFLATESLAVIAAPAQQPTELVLFVAGLAEPPALDAETLGLPTYMLPNRTVIVPALPTNPHGKLDRAALQSLARPAS